MKGEHYLMKHGKKLLTTALSLAMAASLLTPASISGVSAAAKPKYDKMYTNFYKNQVYSVSNLKKGYTVRLSVTGKAASAFSLVKSGKEVSQLKATSSKVKFTARVSASQDTVNKTAVITSVVYDKKGKKIKTLKDTVRVKAHTTAVALTAEEKTIIGEPVQIGTTLVPSYSTDDVTYQVIPSGASISATGSFVADKPGTYTVTASSYKSTSQPVQIAVSNAIQSVKQTASDSFTVTLAGEIEGNVSAGDFFIVNSETNAVSTVKKAVVDEKDARIIYLTTAKSYTDGKNYTLSYQEMTKSFTVTDGIFHSMKISPTSIPCGTETEIVLTTYDKNGIVIKTIPYGSKEASAYHFEIKPGNGYISGSKLQLYAKGDTATATASYDGDQYDANGKATNAAEIKQTITATEQEVVTVNQYYLHVADAGQKYSNVRNEQISRGDVKDIYFCFMNSKNEEITHYEGYTVTSSDSNVLAVTSPFDSTTKSIGVTALKEGTVTLTVRDASQKVVHQFQLQVQAERAIASVNLSETGITLSTAASDQKVITVTAKDQYGQEMPAAVAANKIAINCITHKNTDGTESSRYEYSSTTLNSVDGQIVFHGEAFTPGTYVYRITVGNNYGGTVTINVQSPDTTKPVSYRVILDQKTADAVVNSTDDANKKIEIRIGKYYGGVLSEYLTLSNMPGMNLTVTKDGKAVDSTFFSFNKNSSVNYFYITKADGSRIERVTAGTYEVSATFTTIVGGNSQENTVTDYIDVSDSQKPVTVEQENETVSAKTLAEAITKAFSFKYDGKVYSNASVSGAVEMNAEDVTNIESTGNGPVYVKSATVYIPVNGIKIPFSVTLEKTITLK